MSDSTSQLDLISSSQAQKEVTANALFDAVSPSAIFGRRASTTTALTWGFYGGDLWVDGVLTTIANGTVALSASLTNYVEATRAGVVSKNTTGFTAGQIPLYTIVTGASSVTSYTDHRIANAPVYGRLSKSVAGSSDVTLTAAESRPDSLVFTGALTGNINVIVPTVSRGWQVYNNTSGSYTLTVKTSAGTGIAVTQGKRRTLECDGTNVVDAMNDAAGSGFAASGANADITSMTALTAPTVAANPIRATDLQAQLANAFTTGGSNTAFTGAPAVPITANATNQRFPVKFHAAAGTTPTLAISGQSALNLKYRDSTGTKQAITAAEVPSGWISDVVNDGTDYVVLDIANSTTAVLFANLPSPTVARQVRCVTDVGPAPGIYLVSDGTIWKPLNGRATLYHRNTSPITVQNLTETTAETVTFPAGLVKAGMRVNVDMRVNVGGLGTASRIYKLFLGPVGSSSSLAGSTTAISSQVLIASRKLLTVDCLANGSAAHLGGPSQPSGFQYIGGLNLPTVDFSAAWEARITLQSAAETAVNITSASWAAGVVTFNATAHTLAVGDQTTIAGVTPSGYNGVYVVATVPNANSFTAALVADPGTYTSGGTTSRISNMILQTLTITLES